MKAILFGATGMISMGILTEFLADKTRHDMYPMPYI